MRIRRLVLLGLTLLLAGLAAVPNGYAQSEIAVDPATTARIKVIHAAPDAPNVDVYVDDVKKLANVPFFTISDYLTVEAGNRNLKVNVANTTTTVINALAPVPAGGVFTVAAVEAPAGSTSPVQPAIIAEDLTVPTTGFAKVRAYHFSPGTPPVQIRVQNGPVLVSNLAYPDATDPLLVASGAYTLEVALAAGGLSAPAALTVPVQLEAGKLYDFYAVGKGAGLRIEARVTDTTGFVRVVHASPDAPNVDVYVDDAKVLSDVPFFTISDYLTVPAGAHRFRVVPAGGQLSAAVIDQTAAIEVKRFYTISAVGLVAGSGDQALQPKISVDDLSTPAPGASRVRAYHFSPNTPAVGVRIRNGATLIPSLSFPNISVDAELPAGSYDLEVFLAATGQTALTLEGVRLDSGKIYDLFAVGLFPNVSVQSKIYGPNATPPYQIFLPDVMLES